MGTTDSTPTSTHPDLSSAQLAGLREALLSERAVYERQAQDLAAEADALMQEREQGDVQFDEESGEGDTLSAERERDLMLSATAQRSVDAIDAALERVDVGTYGVCTRCTNPIPFERLEAIPEASMCIPCKSRLERRR